MQSLGSTCRTRAQRQGGDCRPELEGSRRSRDIRLAAASDERDVLLDVLLKVELIGVLVEGLRAHRSMQVKLADLLKLSVGAAPASTGST